MSFFRMCILRCSLKNCNYCPDLQFFLCILCRTNFESLLNFYTKWELAVLLTFNLSLLLFGFLDLIVIKKEKELAVEFFGWFNNHIIIIFFTHDTNSPENCNYIKAYFLLNIYEKIPVWYNFQNVKKFKETIKIPSFK